MSLRALARDCALDFAPPGTNTIQPDHLAEPTFADYEAGRDVILETIRGLVQK